jgi:trigger factor
MSDGNDKSSDAPEDETLTGAGGISVVTDEDTDADAAAETEEKQPLTLDVDVQESDACSRHVVVSVSREDVDRYLDEAFNELSPQAEVAGFRKGRAPRKLIEQRFKKEIRDQVKGQLLMDSLQQVTEEAEFSAISEPDFDYEAVEVPDEGPLTFEFDIEVRPEFDMPKWEGLKLKKLVRENSKDEVDGQIDRLRERYADLAPHDGPAEPGDYVVCDVTFRHGGENLSKMEEASFRLKPTLSFADGEVAEFDKLMTGAKEDDKLEAKVKLSEDAAREELVGAEVTADFKVLEVKRLELPEIDDDFLSKLGGVENEGELRDEIVKQLDRQLNYHQEQSIREQITAQLTESADWELPADLLKRQSRRELERATLDLRSAGFSETEVQARENMMRQNIMARTATSLKEHFILERIAEEQEIEETDQDYEMEIMMIAAQAGESPRRVRAQIEKRGQMDVLRNQIIERKVIAKIRDAAEFEDTPYEPEEDYSDIEGVDFTISAADEAAIPDAKYDDSEVKTGKTEVK